MSYNLGKLLRVRYHTFLGDLYTSEIVDPTSTAYERTRMTILLVLAGLFPPAPSQKWHDSLNWSPIPYNYDKPSKDFVSITLESTSILVLKTFVRAYNDLHFTVLHTLKNWNVLWHLKKCKNIPKIIPTF